MTLVLILTRQSLSTPTRFAMKSACSTSWVAGRAGIERDGPTAAAGRGTRGTACPLATKRNELGCCAPSEKLRKTSGASHGAVVVLKMMRQPAEIGWSQVR